MKKLLVSCVSVFTVLMFVGTALATPGLVDIRTTVPNIAKSLCDQAGSQSLAIPDQTTMQVGDVIQFTLDTGVTICKTLDFYIPIALSAAYIPPSLPGDAVEVTDAVNDVINTNAGTNAPVYGGIDDIGFHVRGNDGSQIYTLQLVKRTLATGALDATGGATGWSFTFSATAGDPANDNLTIKLFDEKTFALGGVTTIDDDTAVAGAYLTAIVASDNVLCIDTLTGDFQGNQVQAFPDSLPVTSSTKLTFTGVYTIANILPANIFTITNPCKDPCPQIEVEATFDQFDNPTSGIDYFDPGNYSTVASCLGSRMTSENTCDQTAGMILRIQKNSTFTVGVKLYLQLEILINGATSNLVLAWEDPTVEPPVVYQTTGESDFCECTEAPVSPVAGLTWTRSSNNTVLTQSLLTPIVATGTGTTLDIDLSDIRITDLDELVEGDQITVEATLLKGNCGELFNGEICVANVLDLCVGGGPPPGTCYSMTIPYSTGIEDPDFWAGIAVSNQSMAAGEYDMMFYDTSGSMATLVDQAIDALAMDVFLNSDIPSMAGFNAGTADLATQMWFVTQTDFFGDVALFIGDVATTYLQGYQSVIVTMPCP